MNFKEARWFWDRSTTARDLKEKEGGNLLIICIKLIA